MATLHQGDNQHDFSASYKVVISQAFLKNIPSNEIFVGYFLGGLLRVEVLDVPPRWGSVVVLKLSQR